MARRVVAGAPLVAMLAMLVMSGCHRSVRSRTCPELRPGRVLLRDGGVLAFDWLGEGPPVVLLHGGMMDRRMWDPQMCDLAARHSVIRVDLRGHGHSPAATAPYSASADLLALMDSLRIPRADLVGLSLGSIVAADFALTYPDRVRRLVLAAPALSGMPTAGEARLEQDRIVRAADTFGADSAVAEVLRTRVFAPALRNPRSAAALRRIVSDQRAMFERRPVPMLPPPGGVAYFRLRELPARTTVIVGDEDVPEIRAVVEGLAAAGRARVTTIRGAGHIVNMEAPSAFTAALRAALDTP